MGSDMRYYRAKRVLVDNRWCTDCVIAVSNEGEIESIQKQQECAEAYIDLGDCSLLPGLIDTHVHGALGCDVMDATHQSMETISSYLASHGVTGFVATTITAPVDKIKTTLMQIGKSKAAGLNGAELLGGYLEGPYFTAKNKGAHPEQLFRELSVEELDSWISYSDNSLMTVALAPEKNNSSEAIRYLRSNGIQVMLGHTDANCQQVEQAFACGASGIVHCYNGMRGLHHRDPGVVGVGLCQPDSFVEIIADGHHVHSTAVDVAYRCCGDRLMLISDAMRAAGMEDGNYQLGEYQVSMKQGVVRTDSGSLAGSTLDLSQAVKNISDWLKIPFEQAWLHGSLTPAKFLKLDHKYGSLAVGKMASMVAVSQSGQVVKTWVNGNEVYAVEPQNASEEVCI